MDHHQPVDGLARSVRWSWLLNKGDMPPGRSGERQGIVVAMARQLVAIGRQLIPLFARNLAGFTADAECGIGEKSHLTHKCSPSSPLRRVSSFQTLPLSPLLATS